MLSPEAVSAVVTTVGFLLSELLPFVGVVKGNGVLHTAYLVLKGLSETVVIKKEKIHEQKVKKDEKS